jgi:hypothetical protein
VNVGDLSHFAVERFINIACHRFVIEVVISQKVFGGEAEPAWGASSSALRNSLVYPAAGLAGIQVLPNCDQFLRVQRPCPELIYFLSGNMFGHVMKVAPLRGESSASITQIIEDGG